MFANHQNLLFLLIPINDIKDTWCCLTRSHNIWHWICGEGVLNINPENVWNLKLCGSVLRLWIPSGVFNESFFSSMRKPMKSQWENQDNLKKHERPVLYFPCGVFNWAVKADSEMPLGAFVFHPILLLVSKAIFMTNCVLGWLCFNWILNLNVAKNL